MIRAVLLIIVGILLGIGLLIGGSFYLESQGAPTPSSICDDGLPGDGWEPTGVNTDRENNTVAITCERGDRTEIVVTELNVMDDIKNKSGGAT